MNTLILIVLLVGAVIGFYQGAFKQIANFSGIFVGLLVASMLYQQCGDYLADKSGTSATVGHMFAFVLIIIIVPMILGWIATLLTKAFSCIHLGFINRACGAAIGVLSYGLVLGFACNAMDFLESRFGFAPESLEEREPSFYFVKHSAQVVVPDMMIVTDSTEVANGEEPHYGLRTSVDKATNSLFNSNKEE